MGVGDDAAVLEVTPGRRLVVTTDVLVEGRHFDARWSTPADWGWKSVTVNLSDLAAMGAEPRWLVLALTVPEGTRVATLDALYAGIAEACERFGVALVGGDTSTGPVLSVAVTAIGEAERVCTRGGARPGDRLAVTRGLGAAAAGLALLQQGDEGARSILDAYPGLAEAHRRPWPELAAGIRLTRLGASALIDVSDGLAGDVLHIAEASGVGVEVSDSSIPLADGVREAAELLAVDPAELALGGGEDFALAAALPRFVDVPGVIDCGRFTEDPEVRVHHGRTGNRPLRGVSFDHFRVK
jgi:thiamine-monophosphate kinase